MISLESNLNLNAAQDTGPCEVARGFCLKSFICDVLRVFWQIKAPATEASEWWRAKSIAALILLLIHFGCVILARSSGAAMTIQILASLATACAAQLLVGIPIYWTVLAEFRIQKSKTLVALAALLSFALPLMVFFTGPAEMTLADYQPLNLAPVLFAFLAYVLSVEKQALDHAEYGLDYLRSLRVETAYREAGGALETVATDDLKVGDTVVIYAGECIPRDGVILKGTTSVDESDLTGEFIPILKEKGDAVVGGSYNRDSDITLRLSQPREHDVLERMIQKTDAAMAEMGPLYGRSQTTTVTVLNLGFLAAIACFVFHFFWRGQTLLNALSPALAILVALPWSLLVLSKLAVGGLMGAAMERGILFTRGKGLSLLSSLKAVFFNKTGTLTLGDFTYSQNFIESGTNLGECLSVAFSLEAYSSHPLAKAMQTHPWYIEIFKHPVNDAQNHPGLGVSGYLAPRSYPPFFAACGNLRYMKRLRFHISKEMKSKIDDLEEMGETVVLCGYETRSRVGSHTRVERQVHGILSFSDTTRKGVRTTLRRLQRIGIETALITGDTEKTVTQLTGTLGIKKIHSRCTPEEKKSKIAKEKESGAKVAIVETDVTDNPALSAADLSLSIATGTAILDHPSDVLILGSDFSLIFWLMQSAKYVAGVVRIAELTGVVLAGLVTGGAFLGFIPPVFAAALSALASVAALKMMLKQI